MRSAVANKRFGLSKPDNQTLNNWLQKNRFVDIKNALSRQLTLQRGHWFEHGVVEAFQANGTKLFTQLEIAVTHNEVPYKAHLDIVLLRGGDHPIIRILELKSCKKIPESLYTSYEVQLHSQLGFLYRFWNSPYFGLQDESGREIYSGLTFPELAQKHFGIVMPDDPSKVDIEGWVLALSMDEAKPFGAYRPNATMFDYALNLGEELWSHYQQNTSLDTLKIAEGFHPLCDFCDHQKSCPKFQGIDLNNSVCDQLILELQERKEQRKILDSEIETREHQVKDFFARCNTNDWLNTADHRFKCTVINGRESLNQAQLKQELSTLIGESETRNLISRCTHSGRPYQRLYISKIK